MQPETLFWTACIPSRILLSTTPLFLPPKPLGIVLAIVATAFTILWAFDLRMDAFEAGGRGTWWHQWRIVHALLYAVAASMLLVAEDKRAWIPLALDVLVAIIARHISK